MTDGFLFSKGGEGILAQGAYRNFAAIILEACVAKRIPEWNRGCVHGRVVTRTGSTTFAAGFGKRAEVKYSRQGFATQLLTPTKAADDFIMTIPVPSPAFTAFTRGSVLI